MQTTMLLATSQRLHHGTALQLYIGERSKNIPSFDRDRNLQVRNTIGRTILSDATKSLKGGV